MGRFFMPVGCQVPVANAPSTAARHFCRMAVGACLPPCVYDVSEQSLRQREMNFAVKKLADMGFVGGLDWPDVLGRASMS